MTTLTIPSTPADITAEWMTVALREGGATRDATVLSVTSEPVGAGVGFIGQLARICLTYDRAEEGAPASCIAKLPTVDQGGREIGNTFRFYEREIRFYDEIAARSALRVPRRLFSAMNVPDDYILIIEDMAPAEVGDQMPGCSVAQAEVAFRNIAGFHAAWWDHPDLERLDWMPDIDSGVQQIAEASYQQCWQPFCGMMGEHMSPELMAMGEALQHHVIDIQHEFAQRPRTINHGDFRLDNMFFASAQGGAPFAICDWQIASKGRGTFDLAYFASNSLPPDLRREHEMRLLRLWHDELTRNGVRGYTFDDAVHDYRLGVLYSWMYAVIAIASLDPSNERGLALFNAWFQRSSAAIADLSVAELMPK
jgi:thiamine kinase-like enzyme